MSAEPYSGWAIVEIMGHRRLAGRVSQIEQFGVAMCRVDVPGKDGATFATQFVGGSSIYALTPVEEAVARALAERMQPEPVTPLELALPAARRSHAFVGEDSDCGLCGEGRAHYLHGSDRNDGPWDEDDDRWDASE